MSQVAEATVPDIAEMAKVVAAGGNLSDAQIWSVVEWLYVAKLGRGDSERLMAEHADDLLSIASTVLPDLGVLVDRRRHDARLGGYEMVRVLSMLRTFPREHKISLFRVYLSVCTQRAMHGQGRDEMLNRHRHQLRGSLPNLRF